MTGLLLDHLWQSTLFALAAALLALALRRNGAQVRYWVWFAAAAKFLVPFAAVAWIAGSLAAHLHAQAPAPPRLDLARQVLAPMTAAPPARVIRAVGGAAFDAGPWLAVAWLCGSAAVLWRRAAQWRALRTALAGASPAPLPIALPAFAAGARSGPAIVGFLRPVLVLPQGLAERLTPAELEAVLEHELHHARRRDNLLTLPLLLAQALFWFHPLVWWLGGRLLAERERACDEAVLEGGIDPETYARGLLEACRLALDPAPALAAAASGGADLKRRIRRIMAGAPPRPLGARGRAMLTAAAGAAVAVPLLAGVCTAAPAATARALVALGRPFAAAVAPVAAPSVALDQAAPSPSPAGRVRITLASAPAVISEADYAPEAARPIRLIGRAAVPEFHAAETAAALAAQPVEAAPPPADADVLRALAARTAYVAGANLGSARLELRAADACPTAGVIEAERRLGGEAISTAFDARARGFVEDVMAGKPHNLSPAMATAVDRALPALRPSLAARFGGPGAARLIGEDQAGRDVYLVRPGAAGYALVLVDDAGRIDGALFCAAG